MLPTVPVPPAPRPNAARAAFALLGLLAILALTPARADNYALVVGIGSYQDDRIPGLPLCLNDVQAVSQSLKTHGFPEDHVITMTTENSGGLKPTFSNIQRRLHEIAGRCQPGDLLLFYFSGHGFTHDGVTYFTGSDTDLDHLAATAVPVPAITDELRSSGASSVFCVIDACRSNPDKGVGDILTDSVAASAKSIIFAPRLKASGVLLACSEEERAYLDDATGQSVFTEYFVKGLNGAAALGDGSITASSLAAYLQGVVPAAAKQAKADGPQNPEGTFAGGSIVLSSRHILTADEQAAANSALVALWNGSDNMVDLNRASALSLDALQKALSAGADINAKNSTGRSSLMAASCYGNVDVAQLLIEHGADVNAKNDEGATALMLAAAQNHPNVAKLLINHGADVNAKDNEGITALIYAAEWDQTDAIAKLLIDHGADVNAKTNEGSTALMCAAEWDQTDAIAKLLIDHGADVNAKNNEGSTALTFAAEFDKSDDIAKLLIDHGADVNAKTNEGSTALMFAAEPGHLDIARLLVDHGADVSVKRNDGATALMLAAEFGHLDVARLLIDHGADVNAKADNGATPLSNAEHSDKTVSDDDKAKMIALLKAAGAK